MFLKKKFVLKNHFIQFPTFRPEIIVFSRKQKKGLHLKLEKPGHFRQPGGTPGQSLKSGTVPSKPGGW